MNQTKKEDGTYSFLLEQLQIINPEIQQIDKLSPVSGGSINKAFTAETPSGNFFIKVNSASLYPQMFECEKKGLELLAQAACIQIPGVYSTFNNGDEAGIICEFIEGGTKTAASPQLLAEGLACLHRCSNDYFGLDHSNYIGSLKQINKPEKSWTVFFINSRMIPLWESARRSGFFSRNDDSLVESIINRIGDIIPDEMPALLHGDLWSGNYMYDRNGVPVIFDPAVYYGFREVDLAMMKLFGGFDQEVFDIYNEIYPLHSHWQERLTFHNLYPLLVHLNLFGRAYESQTREVLLRFA